MPQAMACHDMSAMQPVTPPASLPMPKRMTGIGNAHIAITTANPEAQIWFDQGLNLTHDFWDYEAAKAFEQSVRVDPQCAMCWWGLASAMDTRSKDSNAAVDDAYNRMKKFKKHTSPAEKLYIEAALKSRKADKLSANNTTKTEKKPLVHRDSDETKSLRKLVALYPETDDASIQARILLAGSLHDGYTKGEPNVGTAEAQRILARIIEQHPNDTAALHYWIHIVEPGNHPEQARDAAVKLGALVPTSGHMVHMPGHIFYLLGEYNLAQTSFAASTVVDETYMRTENVMPDDDWNYVHNLMYSIADLMEAGRFAEANLLAEKTSAAHGTRPNTLYVGVPRDGISRLNVKLPSALRAADWTVAQGLLQSSDALAIYPNLVLLRQGLLAYVQGQLALEANDTKTAQISAAALDQVVTKAASQPGTSAMQMPGMNASPQDAMLSPLHAYLAIAALELKAGVEMEQGHNADADRDFTQAIGKEATLRYLEPPMYLRPAAEAEASSLMRAHRYTEARTALLLVIKRRPQTGFALYGIARADDAMGAPTATESYRNFLAAWSKADASLPQMVQAKTWITSHQVAAGQ